MSANSGETFVDIMGGLWLGDYVGAFLTGGGTGTFFFHYMPAPLEASCNNSWGTFGMLKVDRDYHVQAYFAQYFAAQVVTREWVQPSMLCTVSSRFRATCAMRPGTCW